MVASLLCEETKHLYCMVDSGARVIRGLTALVLTALNSKTPEEIVHVDLEDWFIKLELHSHLSSSRINELKAIIVEIPSVVKRYISTSRAVIEYLRLLGQLFAITTATMVTARH